MTNISDVLSVNSESLAKIWIRKVRKAPNLKSYNNLDDDALIKINSRIYRTLALWFEKEADRNQIGAFFADIGKSRRREGFAVSEVAYALFLAQRAVLEYLTTDYLNDSSLALYNAMNLSGQVADFFLLGTYYMMKGYLEDTFIALNRDESMPIETLRKYFCDEFFFKDNSPKG
jgi:hypothetical protein